MAIEINGLNNPHAAGTAGGSQISSTRNESSGNAATQGASNPAASDTVQLTATAQQLDRLAKHLEGVPVVDSQRVEQTRSAISSGNYQVNAGNVSQKLMQFEAYLPADR